MPSSIKIKLWTQGANEGCVYVGGCITLQMLAMELIRQKAKIRTLEKIHGHENN